ncbi:MAG: hypothetical protein GXP49_17830 [Deltaproteobacteria bacterium]|nr:hypothetical protein [Deltaproteobacteria bacterium]
MRESLVATCVAITAALFSVPVQGGPFGRKASQVDVPKLIIERPLTLGRGVLELSLGYSNRSVNSVFDSGGSVEPSVKAVTITTRDLLKAEPEEVTTKYNILDLSLNFGLTNNLSLGFDIPFYFVGQNIDNFDALVASTGGDAQVKASLKDQEPTATNMGDARLWAIYQFWGKAAPLSSFAVKAVLKTASGNDSFGEVTTETAFNNEKGEWYPEDATDEQIIKDRRTILTGTGQVDFALSLLYKQQLGPAAGTVEVGYNARFEDRVMYMPYLLGNTVGFTGKIDPGDEVFANANLTFQPMEYFAVGADFRFFYRQKSRAAWPKMYYSLPDEQNQTDKPNDIFVGDTYRDVLVPEFAKDQKGDYLVYRNGKEATPVVDSWHSSEGYLFTLRPKLYFFITDHLDITIAADFHLMGKNMGNITNYLMGESRGSAWVTSNNQVIYPNDALGTDIGGGVIFGSITGKATVRF